jgi:hypothetical protein
MLDRVRWRSTAAYPRMPKRRATYGTFWQATPSIAHNNRIAALLSICALFALCAQTPIPKVTLPEILHDHLAALQALHLKEPRTEQILGTLEGLDATGEFHEWHDGQKQRRDERLGFRTQRLLRVGDKLWVQNANGEIRELEGIGARRQITADFVDSGAFARTPQYVKLLKTEVLPNGRSVYELDVAPPKGEPYVVGIDTQTYLIDETSYVDHDGRETSYYSDYRVVQGVLVPYAEVDSNGDSAYDVTSHVTDVVVDAPVDDSIFSPLTSNVVQTDDPVKVPLVMAGGLPFAAVTIDGKSFHFLIDSGSQGDVLDVATAKTLGLQPQGALEITGAARVASEGVVQTPDIAIGGLTLPMHVAAVVDLGGVPVAHGHIDGVLGYPLFAAAEVRIDPDTDTMTIAKPGTLPQLGDRIPVDTDRELPEITASVQGAKAPFVLDTGNSRELLIFKNFINKYPSLISWLGNAPVRNFGVGGPTDAVSAIVSDLQIGTYDLYNRYANVVMSRQGAFADENDGGNIGEGVMQNFVVTFDLFDHFVEFDPAKRFDNGRYRPIQDPIKVP